MSQFQEFDFAGKKALVRVDFNVPLNDALEVTDDTRIQAALPTIKNILAKGGAVVLMSHLGRPKGAVQEKFSLKNIVTHLSKVLGQEVQFVNDCIGAEAWEASANLKAGQVLLLENLRFHSAETSGDEAFSKALAKHADVYVNDAFGTAHRAHASTAIIAQYFDKAHKMFGLLLNAEVTNANKVLKEAERPFTAILGGAKVSDKILIIEKLLDVADNIIIGGGMAYTFLKAQENEIGNSLCEDDKIDLAGELMQKAINKGVQLLIPKDSVVADAFSNDANTKELTNDNIEAGWMGLDIGSQAVKTFSEVIMNSKTILWNGPMGVFEMEKFQSGTKAIAEVIAEATAKGAFSLIGGGDSVAAINKFNLADKVSYVSTGGGAMLEFFEGKSLPGVEAILS
jgi:phosphoglycerate kinase